MHSSRRLLLLVVFIITFSYVAARLPKNVTVNKCCSRGRSVAANSECTLAEDDEWWPLIVMVVKKAYFQPKGQAPKFMNYRQSRPYCTKPELYIGSHKFALFSNGTLYLSEKHKFIEPDNYCIDKDTAIICDPDANSPDALVHADPTAKLRKCCVHDAAYMASENICVAANGLTALDTQLTNHSQQIVFGFPECSSYFTIAETFDESSFNRNANQLILKTGQTLNSNDFCVDYVITDSQMDEQPSLNVFTCADRLVSPQYSTHTDIRFILFPIGLLISVVFLLFTLLTRSVLPTSHHILHWRCQTFYVTCLMIGDFLLAITQLFGRNAKGFICITIAVCMHFFFLSAFFWLNTMCFNIYWTFRDFRPTSLERSEQKVRLRIYKFYAWGVPLLISGVAATADYTRKNSLAEGTYLRPQFCQTEHWFAGNLEKLTYFYGPIGVLLFINLALFASTARQLTCGLWKREEVKSTTERTTLGRICIKLVIVMGVTWIADVLSWAHGVWYSKYQYLWIVTDLMNTLQGVFIFIVIGCQPQISGALRQIWRTKNIQCRHRNAESGKRNSSSSQVAPSLGESVTNNTLTTSNAKSAETAF